MKIPIDAARRLYLFNHDDEAVANKEPLARVFFEQRGLDIRCVAAREGVAMRLATPGSVLQRPVH